MDAEESPTDGFTACLAMPKRRLIGTTGTHFPVLMVRLIDALYSERRIKTTPTKKHNAIGINTANTGEKPQIILDGPSKRWLI